MHVAEVGDRGEVGDHVRRVLPEQHRVEEEPVAEAVDATGRLEVLRARRGRRDRVEVERDADLGVRRWPRIASTARPWPSSRWCAARTAAAGVAPARARDAPEPYPRKAEHHGSLSVVKCRTRSPSAPCTIAAYSAKRAAVSRAGQPPASSIGCGRSQW